MKATPQQINICANVMNRSSDAAERYGAAVLASSLFPESWEEIQRVSQNHPVNVRWREYITTKGDRSEFFLPE